MSIEKIACHCCDLVQELSAIQPGQKAHCSRCGHLLTVHHTGGLDTPMALAFSGLVFLLLSLPFPFMAFESQGRVQEVSLANSGFDLLQQGFPLLALLLTLFILLIPALTLCTYLLILFTLRQEQSPPWLYRLTRMLFILHPWGMAEVFLIGVLVSLVKIAGMADIIIGVSFWAYVLFALCLITTITRVDPAQLWQKLDQIAGIHRKLPSTEPGSALKNQLQSCHHCGLLHPLDTANCERCGSPLHARFPNSLQKTWAYLITAILLYLPANLYPIMNTTLLGNSEPSTILGGVLVLWEMGSYPIALIVFIASIMIPIGKMLALIWLAYSVQHGHQHRVSERIKMYRLTELIGRWSMIDVFVVAVLAALVQLGGLVSITPGIAVIAFAGVVILTMLSALSFDPRLIWDSLSQEEMAAINRSQVPLNDLLDDLR
ncbi:paraquat-inducible protein A [Neptuniibacter halophilus]|uniref:paraquat-inducible protein A n=1 Tax=Neptuniibacter halophilus TaxID=651666 RepID=UPI00257287DE|nr:paraquat-inducible protein A [Neptuniibacter halophilus]